MTTILLFNFPETEQKTWRLLLRKMPGVRLLPVKQEQFGVTIGRLLEGQTEPGPVQGGAFDQRMVVFADAAGPFLEQLIDMSHQVTAEKTYRAVLTETNRKWNAIKLFSNLQAEEAYLQKHKR